MNNTVKQLLQLTAGAICLAGAGTLFYANQIETKKFKLEKLKVELERNKKNNPEKSRRIWKVLHISDLHLSFPEYEKVDFLQKITDDDYDLVILTGDVYENFTGLPYTEKILTRKPRIGAYAVLGNHDYYNYTIKNRFLGKVIRSMKHPSVKRDVSPMIRALEKSGFQVLRNQSVNLKEHGLHIVGIDYPTAEEAEIHKLIGKAEEDQCKLVLFHVPMNLETYAQAGADIVFGGHTHGGQIRLPKIGALTTDSELERHEAYGLVKRGNTIFHISRGLGADPRTNIRLFCPPAATVLEVTFGA